MTSRWRATSLLLRDLVTAAALIWMTVSDDWLAIGVSGAFVASRVLAVPLRPYGALSGSRKVHELPSSG